jgi:hypothetical protein
MAPRFNFLENRRHKMNTCINTFVVDSSNGTHGCILVFEMYAATHL